MDEVRIPSAVSPMILKTTSEIFHKASRVSLSVNKHCAHTQTTSVAHIFCYSPIIDTLHLSALFDFSSSFIVRN